MPRKLQALEELVSTFVLQTGRPIVRIEPEVGIDEELIGMIHRFIVREAGPGNGKTSVASQGPRAARVDCALGRAVKVLRSRTICK
jgi:hypothetical protein